VARGGNGKDAGRVSLTEQMDTATPQGEFLFHVFGALAQFERSLTERIRACLAAAQRRSRQSGCPVAINASKLMVVAALDSGDNQSRSLPHIRHQAQHPDRLAGPDRLVYRSQRRGRQE
jgi:hypothetical protein